MLTAEGAESAEVFIGKHKTRLIGFSIRNVFSVYSVASAVKRVVALSRLTCAKGASYEISGRFAATNGVLIYRSNLLAYM